MLLTLGRFVNTDRTKNCLSYRTSGLVRSFDDARILSASTTYIQPTAMARKTHAPKSPNPSKAPGVDRCDLCAHRVLFAAGRKHGVIRKGTAGEAFFGRHRRRRSNPHPLLLSELRIFPARLRARFSLSVTETPTSYFSPRFPL